MGGAETEIGQAFKNSTPQRNKQVHLLFYGGAEKLETMRHFIMLL